MNVTLKAWLVGALNAAISGITTGAAGIALGIGWKKAAIMLGISAGVSFGKYFAQHPIPGGPNS